MNHGALLPWSLYGANNCWDNGMTYSPNPICLFSWRRARLACLISSLARLWRFTFRLVSSSADQQYQRHMPVARPPDRSAGGGGAAGDLVREKSIAPFRSSPYCSRQSSPYVPSPPSMILVAVKVDIWLWCMRLSKQVNLQSAVIDKNL